MTKFQKFQKYSSIIPFFSTFFVFMVTMFQLKRKHASFKSWVLFGLIFFVSGIVVFLFNTVIMSGSFPILNIIASGALLVITNHLCVDLQIKCDSVDSHSEKHPPKAATFIGIGLVVAAVGVVAVLLMVFWPSVDIADSNGNDSSLAVLTLDELLSEKNQYSARGMYYFTEGNQTKVGKKWGEVDYDTCSFSFEKISGTKTLHATKVNADTVTLHITSELTSGNAEIVILADGEYYTHAPVGQEQDFVLEKVSGKLVLVRLGAESAEFSVSVSRTIR